MTVKPVHGFTPRPDMLTPSRWCLPHDLEQASTLRSAPRGKPQEMVRTAGGFLEMLESGPQVIGPHVDAAAELDRGRWCTIDGSVATITDKGRVRLREALGL